MPFRIEANESVPSGIRRVVREQVDRALAELTSRKLGRREAVHQTRKRFKKVRGVLRLMQFEMDDQYKTENVCFRDTGRELAPLRDAQAMIGTFDKLIERLDRQLDYQAFKSVRAALIAQRKAVVQKLGNLDSQIEAVVETLHEARKRIASWPLKTDSFDAIGCGLKKHYKRCRKALARTYRKPTAACFHEWRKAVKYHWHHVRLLECVWPELMKGYRRSLKNLSDVLGDAHDLSVFQQRLRDAPDTFGEERDVQALLALTERRQAELRTRAQAMGDRLFVERPAAFVRRFHQYWNAWRREIKLRPALSRPAIRRAA